MSARPSARSSPPTTIPGSSAATRWRAPRRPGVAHARADLFEGAVWYLTPGVQTSGELYERLHRLLVSLGARPTAIDADAHDRMLASVSHLPHVLANVLVAQAAATLGGERLPATGPSFRDATRVAGAPSAIWTDIYLSNRDALVAELDDFVGRLAAVRGALEHGDADAITAWNDAAAGDRRRLLDGRSRGRRAVRTARLGAEPAGGDRAAGA